MSLLWSPPSLTRVAALGVALLSLAAVSGCASRAGATAASPRDSATSVSSPTAAPSSSTSSPSSPAVVPSKPKASHTSPKPAPTTPKAAPAPVNLVLAPTGIGGLHLGMSKSAALATGLIAGPDAKVQGSTDCRVYDGRHGVDLVYLSGGKVQIISVRSPIRTDKGIGIGDTYLALHKQYPDALDTDDSGRAFTPAPGASIKAGYRFGISGAHSYPNSKITSIALQGDDQPCYE